MTSRFYLRPRREEQGENYPSKTDDDAEEQKFALGAHKHNAGQQKEEEKKPQPEHKREFHPYNNSPWL